MNNNLNIFVVPCQTYEQKSNSVIGIYNSIEIQNGRMDLCVFTGLNYVGDADKARFKLDYFLKCIVDEDDSGKEGRKIPLFAIEGVGKKEFNFDENHGTYETMFAQESNIPIPCSGIYELQVYALDDDMEMQESPRERYIQYQERKKLPSSAFRFKIKNEQRNN